MIDRDAVGAEGTPFEMRIEAGKIAEFARAVHAHHAAHAGETAVVPATFLTSQFFWEERVDDANPWHLAKMSQERGMHAEQEYVFHGPPPRAGDTLSARYSTSCRDGMLDCSSHGIVVCSPSSQQ